MDKKLGIVITRWKDSRILQTVSTIMKPGVKTIGRGFGLEILDMRCPRDIVGYQTYMDGVDRGGQHIVMGDCFANMAHFKKNYKKVFMRIADFNFLQVYILWNSSVEELKENSTGGEIKRKQLEKW